MKGERDKILDLIRSSTGPLSSSIGAEFIGISSNKNRV